MQRALVGLFGLVLVSACNFHLPGGNNVIDGPPDTPNDVPVDMPVDMPIDMPPPIDAQVCFGTFSPVCLASAPIDTVTLSARINTDTSGLCLATTVNTDNACVVAGTDVTVSGTVPVEGTKPLIVIATTGAINLGGTLDVASHRGGTAGPGANSSQCIAATAPKNSGGGSGGSFGGAGGNGGSGSFGIGGIAAPAQLATNLRGGCRGATAGGSSPGIGGSGGGAVDLVATSITVTGLLNASGAGGTGGTTNSSGGGGGGSGGLVVFDCTNLTIAANARVLANGAGGGEGSGDVFSGNAGFDPNPGVPGTGPPGGSGGANGGGNGGSGGASLTAFAQGGANGINGLDAGGGAGGGTGLVHTTAAAPSVAGTVSPKLN